MDKEATRFRVLLAEDDPVSREFLLEAIRSGGAEVSACTDGPSALAQARAGAWDLLIFDHHLPGLDGDAVLMQLRADPGTRAQPPAIATTAEPESGRPVLLRAGFAEVLPKPLGLSEVHAALRRYGCVAAPLDDVGALRVCGSATAVEQLRRLFAEQELPNIQHQLDQHRDQPHALRPTLHRLRAACGFCGAPTLAHATATLHEALAGNVDDARVQAALQDFTRTLQATRASLRARLDEAD